MSYYYRGKKFDMEKLLTTIGVKSGEFIDIAGIKLQIYYLNKQKDDVFIQIGRLIYKMYKKGRFDSEGVYDKCEYIAKLDEQIKSKETDLESVKKGAHSIIKNARHKKKHRHKKHDEIKDIVLPEKYDVKPMD